MTKDRIYNLKVVNEKLEKARKYCDDNNISLPMEIRKVIDKYWKLQIEEENKGGM